MVTRGAVGCWDNSTRGLDASTALEYCRSLRVLTDIAKISTIVTMYQASESLYQVSFLMHSVNSSSLIKSSLSMRDAASFLDPGLVQNHTFKI